MAFTVYRLGIKHARSFNLHPDTKQAVNFFPKDLLKFQVLHEYLKVILLSRVYL